MAVHSIQSAGVTSEVAQEAGARVNAAASTMIDVRDVTVSFAGFKALDGLNFSMQQGELRFIIGPNGAGKTTLLDVLTGKVRPIQGSVYFGKNVNVLNTPEHRLVQAGIARKFQTATIFNSLTVFENLEAAVGFHDNSVKLFTRLSSERRERIEATMEKIGLTHRANVRGGILAHGEKQWLEIGMLLVQQPKLLLLDEPVAGMTRQEREKTGELIHALEGRHTILITEHDMDFVRRFSRTVTVMHLGKVLTEGPMEEVQ